MSDGIEQADGASGGAGKAAAGDQSPGAKATRSAKQAAQFEAMRAKRWANAKAKQARAAGVDTTPSAGPDVLDLPPGAPSVQTTAHTTAPKSPEQLRREAEARGEPLPQPGEAMPAAPDDSKRAARGERVGLLGLIADGLGL